MFPELNTRRLTLRSLEPSDAGQLYDYRSHPEVSRYQSWEPASPPEVSAFIERLRTMDPLTPGEWTEWGNPITDPEAFKLLRSYSPYDNVTAKAYPPMLITGGLNDPRVTYWEPAKWVAKLRELKTDNNELLLKTNMGAGHGGKSGRWNALYETAEEFAFLLWQMGMSEKSK